MGNKNFNLEDIPWETKDNILTKSPVQDDNGFNMEVLKLKPYQKIPYHSHTCTNYNYILMGSMSDLDGKYTRGDLVINKAGSKHEVKAGFFGCKFLVFWNESKK